MCRRPRTARTNSELHGVAALVDLHDNRTDRDRVQGGCPQAWREETQTVPRPSMLAYAKVMSQADAWMEFYRQQAEANQRKEKTACNAE
jgi:hypothetical protein